MSKYEFETPRLGFRQWKEEDKSLFAKMNASSEVMRYFPSTLAKEQSDEFYNKIVDHFEENGYGLWAVEEKQTGEFIGFIGFYNATFEAEFTPCVEIGWRLDNKFWNKGYATEGAGGCLKHGFDELDFEEIYSFTAEINKPSINVMEKIGLTKQGEFNHPRVQKDSPLLRHVLYKINASDYEKLII